MSFFLDAGTRLMTFLAMSLNVQASTPNLRCSREARNSIESPSTAWDAST